jgi:citronellol/citronellal dehydrogenase
MGVLDGKVAVVTGGSRGIGRVVALTLAREGADVVVAAKSDTESPKLPGTIHSVAAEIEALGRRALAVRTDVRNDDDIERMVSATMTTFGRIDILVNNAGALWWMPVAETPMKRFDLVMDVNVRAAFACTRACLPHLLADGGGHVLVYSPPVDLGALGGKIAYLISKYGMTMLALGLADELRGQALSVNALWPVTLVESQATINHHLGGPGSKMCRKPDIIADATLEIVKTPPGELSGQALLDEDFLRSRGWTDFVRYRCDPDHEPPRVTARDIPRAGVISPRG